MDAAGAGTVCRHCGHTRRTRVSTTHRVLRAVRRKPVRATCGEPTDLGWPCPCRSRFHAG
jgi:hypothetical protein